MSAEHEQAIREDQIQMTNDYWDSASVNNPKSKNVNDG